MNASRPPRLVLYVQHLLGIGHLARASRIAAALVDDGFEVTMVTGGLPVAGFPGAGVRHVALPPIASSDAGFSGLVDDEGRPVDAAFERRRREILIETVRDCRPDVLLIEAFPFGRRQVRFELIPLLDEMHAARDRPRIVTSVRDILQARNKPGRDAETVAVAKRYFDRVLVHGDPDFVRLEETFPPAEEIADLVRYTGLVAPPPPPQSADRFDVVVSAGGGAVGASLLRAAAEAASGLPQVGTWCLVAGQNLPAAAFDAIAAIAPPQATLTRFRPDFGGLLAGARLSVSQAGYNTVCDLLVAGCRSLLVPFTAGGETEQRVRAERLSRLGIASVLAEEALSVDSMAASVANALAAPPPPRHPLDIDGARRTAQLLREML